MFLSEEPVSIEAGNNKYKHKNNKINKNQPKNCISYKEKINNTTKGNEMKKSASRTTKEMSTQDEEKNARTQIVKPRRFNLSSKTLFRYQTNILLCGWKFIPTPNRNNIFFLFFFILTFTRLNVKNYNHQVILTDILPEKLKMD